MTLSIKDPEVGRLAQELAELTGERIEDAVAEALRGELARQREVQRVLRTAREISDHFMSLSVIDPRSPDEILGYDETGCRRDTR